MRRTTANCELQTAICRLQTADCNRDCAPVPRGKVHAPLPLQAKGNLPARSLCMIMPMVVGLSDSQTMLF